MAFVESINMSCNSEVCADVDWGGNPDIGGIGLMIVYYWLLGLVLVFAMALAIPFGRALLKLGPVQQNVSPRPQSREQSLSSADDAVRSILERFFDAFTGTITPLFDMCLTFTLAAEVSTLAFHSQAVSRYEMVIAELLCVFTSSACIALWFFQFGIARFRIPRFCFYLAVWPFLIAIIVEHNTMKVRGMKNLVMKCLDNRMGRYTESPRRDYTLFSAWGFVSMSQVLVTLEKVDLRMINRIHFQQAVIFGRRLALVTPLLSCVLMIWCVAEMTTLRGKMKEMAGSEYDENSWGFGQVFALATWFPIVLCFVYFLFCKPEDGFESHLPEDWIAVKRSLHVCTNCRCKICRCPKYQDQADDAKAKNVRAEARAPRQNLIEETILEALE
ncbi:hypothetical protein V8E51_009947 [Hyaloscypha variabilis]